MEMEHEIFRTSLVMGGGFGGNYSTISVEKLYQAFKKRLKNETVNEVEDKGDIDNEQIQ